MSLFPAGFRSQLRNILLAYGESVTYFDASLPEGTPGKTVMASVQIPVDVALQADAGQEGFIVFISPEDLPVMPREFDRLFIRGRNRTIQEPHETRGDNAALMWQMRAVG